LRGKNISFLKWALVDKGPESVLCLKPSFSIIKLDPYGVGYNILGCLTFGGWARLKVILATPQINFSISQISI
jgi:hypothetical protein